MSAQILQFAGAADRRHAGPRRYRFAEMIQRLALVDYSERSQIEHLRQLVRLDGLPAPINPRLRAGGVLRGADAVGRRSWWDAAEVDAWLARPGPGAPPAPGAIAIPAARGSLHDEMRARAAALAGRVAHG